MAPRKESSVSKAATKSAMLPKTHPLKTLERYNRGKTSCAAREFREAGAVNSNTTEVVMDITRLTDLKLTGSGTTNPVLVIGVNLLSSLLGDPDTDFGEAVNMLRVLSFECFVLPMTSIGSSVSARTFSVVYGCPVRGNDGGKYLAAQRTTLVKPDYDIDWIKVASWKAASLFADATQQPVVAESASDSVMELGNLSILDPDSGNYATADLQVMYRIRVAQPVPVINNAKLTETLSIKWLGTAGGSQDKYALLQPIRISDSS